MSDDKEHDKNGRRAPPCPICGKPAAADYPPFCSRRCADIDLGRWLKGSYAIPVKETGDEDDGEGEDEAGRR